MTRKKFIKTMMSFRISRNDAIYLADFVKYGEGLEYSGFHAALIDRILGRSPSRLREIPERPMYYPL